MNSTTATTTLSASASVSSSSPTSTSLPVDVDPPVRHVSPVVAFIIGFSIILVASMMNAGGLNITKLDHVRTNAIPKAQRRKDWLRPLWILGMLLYIVSQLIGSTLALEFMRAEYVAPLGSTSLIFNFLFASILIGTPVSSTDIYGTALVVLGVIGIVAFGSINSGLETEINIALLSSLWGRAGWIVYFVIMSALIVAVYLSAAQLDLVLIARGELESPPSPPLPSNTASLGFMARTSIRTRLALRWLKDTLDNLTASRDDKALAWTLGIAWACCGGALAGGTLVFAKATVKLVTGAMKHENTAGKAAFYHPAAIFTFLFLAVSAVAQIVCLNRGLRVYDSTLVVPVFYGIYTASGFLNSLIFNNEVDAYKTWTLFLIFVSIMILISGVVLLTHKNVDAPKTNKNGPGIPLRGRKDKDVAGSTSEREGLHAQEEGRAPGADVVWEVGEASDDEDEPAKDADGATRKYAGEEGAALIHEDVPREPDGGVEGSKHRRHDDEEFGDWEDGAKDDLNGRTGHT